MYGAGGLLDEKVMQTHSESNEFYKITEYFK